MYSICRRDDHGHEHYHDHGQYHDFDRDIDNVSDKNHGQRHRVNIF